FFKLGIGTALRMAVSVTTVLCLLRASHAQDLAPRAYVITPIHSNAVTVTSSFFTGNLLFDGTVPITGASARASVTAFNFTHSLLLRAYGQLPRGIALRCRELSGEGNWCGDPRIPLRFAGFRLALFCKSERRPRHGRTRFW